MAAAVMAHPLEPRDRDRRVYNPTVVDKGFAAPLASVESLSDVVREAGLVAVGRPSPRSLREPSSGADSGRWSPSTILEVTDPSLSDGSGGGASSGIDTASLSGTSAPHAGAPLTAMNVEDAAEAETLPSLGWPPGPSDSPGGGFPGGLGGHEVDGCWGDRIVKPAVDEPLNLSFHKLSYTVSSRLRLRWEKRRILDGISGEFKAGQLTAIMGPSGAGKSTLLDVMSGYTSSGVHGRLLVNGTARDSRTFRRQSVYIQQDASLHPQLTVSEAMNVASVLKLGRRGPEIDEVLYSLGLLEHRDTMTSRLSGGQLKRLATALELLSNPPVMFFDEPTSGLDSSTTKQCVGVLRRLARQGRTVVCTIHQPSATVFEMLDQLYLVVGGRCAYSGHTANLLPYLAGLGLRCPPYHNPADYALEVAGGEYGDFSEELVKASENGRCVMWTTTYTTRQQEGHRQQQALEVAVEGPSSNKLSRQSSSVASSSSQSEQRRCDRTKLTYPTTFWLQLYVLLKRTFLKGLRDRMLCHSRLYIHLVAGLLIGVLFLDIGGDAAHVFHNFSLLFFCLMFLMFTALSAMILAFPLEMPIIAREHFNRWYSLKSYFLAVTMADVPLQGMCVCVYTVVVYYMTAQPMEPLRFLQFLLICSLVSFVAQSVGLAVGAAMKVEHGVIFGPLVILPFTIFSGYFVIQRDAPTKMQWLFAASYLKYGLSGSMLAVYGYGRAPLERCSDDYCHFKRPEKFLHELDLDRGNYWQDAGILFLIGSVLRLSAYFVLKFRLRRFRQ
ncbi:ATP-binding cassette sub-family G member 4 [Frankliniella fusca]|uniref:ATP-binding cassette sub-family G member 4 n=1 Tax=Frankliniella fusca TaxID=407009 RepID=A0AAE1LQ36_9NEOP|nr:ATP-binding cassette sub-family G member 4 [Frankliniella fusca]